MLKVRCRALPINRGELETVIYLNGSRICRAVTNDLSTKNDAEELEKYLNSKI